jgi:2-phosphoxylose phosphatase
MFLELAQNLLSFESGMERNRMRIYVGHDGSMIRLASGLGIKGPLKWPAMGSEISMEVCPIDIQVCWPFGDAPILTQVWETETRQKFVRVFHEGTVAPGFEWIPFQTFVPLLQSNVPSDLTAQCA